MNFHMCYSEAGLVAETRREHLGITREPPESPDILRRLRGKSQLDEAMGPAPAMSARVWTYIGLYNENQ